MPLHSYGLGEGEAMQAMRVGVIACGYADGYPRHAKDGAPVWVFGSQDKTQGAICSIAGQVSMDMLTIDLSHAPWARVGTSVELWGKNLPVDNVANHASLDQHQIATFHTDEELPSFL